MTRPTLRDLWDTRKALKAHERLAGLPTKRVDNAGPHTRVFHPNGPIREHGQAAPHLCRVCSETREDQFYAKRKSLCKACMLTQGRARALAKRKKRNG